MSPRPLFESMDYAEAAKCGVRALHARALDLVFLLLSSLFSSFPCFFLNEKTLPFVALFGSVSFSLFLHKSCKQKR